MKKCCACASKSWNRILISAPAANWPEAAEKARYLLKLYSAVLTSQDPRRQTLIVKLLEDFDRLAASSGD